MLLKRVAHCRYSGIAQRMIPATAINESWNEISKRRWLLKTSIKRAVEANIFRLSYSCNDDSENCSSENIIAARTALGDIPQSHT